MTAGVIGATGYAGAELVRLLSGHREIDRLVLSSVSFEGKNIGDVYPNFLGQISEPLVKAEEVIAAADVVFSALPHAVGEPYAHACIEKGIPFIDLSADFRFGNDEAAFSAWYSKPYHYPQLRDHSVYGLPELNRKRVKELAAAGKVIVGNPGCYPTSASLGAFPALAERLPAGSRLADTSATVIINSLSGVTGGGREPSRSFHFPECSDAVSPYKIGSHRHTPEIARNFAAMTGNGNCPAVIFTPHLAPMNRGILSTIYIPLSAEWRCHSTKTEIQPPSNDIEQQAAAIRALYADFYSNEPFVRVLPEGITAATNRVRQSNFCDISVHLDHNGSTLIVCSAIDNMIKGAAGQAIQNMNIIFDYNERTGLEQIPALF